MELALPPKNKDQKLEVTQVMVSLADAIAYIEGRMNMMMDEKINSLKLHSMSTTVNDISVTLSQTNRTVGIYTCKQVNTMEDVLVLNQKLRLCNKTIDTLQTRLDKLEKQMVTVNNTIKNLNKQKREEKQEDEKVKEEVNEENIKKEEEKA